MKYMRAATLGLALTMGLYATACAPQTFHIAVAADTAIVKALHQARLDERVAFQSNLFSADQHRKNLKTLIQVDHDALALTDAIDTWHKAGSNPTTIPTLITTTKGLLKQMVDDLNLPSTSPLMVSINKILAFLQ